jgi:WD40 repeat protein
VKTGKERATLAGYTAKRAAAGSAALLIRTIFDVKFGSDGKTLASGSADKTIKLWDVRTGKETATLKGHTDFVYTVAFSPDEEMLASGGVDRTIILWDVKAGKKR